MLRNSEQKFDIKPLYRVSLGSRNYSPQPINRKELKQIYSNWINKSYVARMIFNMLLWLMHLLGCRLNQTSINPSRISPQAKLAMSDQAQPKLRQAHQDRWSFRSLWPITITRRRFHGGSPKNQGPCHANQAKAEAWWAGQPEDEGSLRRSLLGWCEGFQDVVDNRRYECILDYQPLVTL
jgi:hypothetical protein